MKQRIFAETIKQAEHVVDGQLCVPASVYELYGTPVLEIDARDQHLELACLADRDALFREITFKLS